MRGRCQLGLSWSFISLSLPDFILVRQLPRGLPKAQSSKDTVEKEAIEEDARYACPEPKPFRRQHRNPGHCEWHEPDPRFSRIGWVCRRHKEDPGEHHPRCE